MTALTTKIKFQPKELQLNGRSVVTERAQFKPEDLDRPFFPTDHILCNLAKITYKDDIEALPDGWNLLTTGRNKKDGYFGAAFWHAENRHLVISHRGTKDLKAFNADFRGVIQNHYTPQVHSACTFAFLALDRLKTECVSLSLTGHSLGGWLAQITAFAIEYLSDEDYHFRRLKDDKEKKYHPHTVTFDSPGCYEMLCKLSKDYSPRYEKKVDDLVSMLDITTYFLAPNLVNAKNQHVGRLISFDFKITDVNNDFFKSLNPFSHLINYHKLNNFLNAFENFDSKHDVLDWPKISISKTIKDKLRFTHKDEYNFFFKFGKESNNFQPDVNCLNEESVNIHYKFEKFKETSMTLNVFTEDERIFLENWKKLKENKMNPLEINSFLRKWNIGSFDHFLADFDIKNGEIKFDDVGKLQEVTNRTKWLFAHFPETNEVMRRQILNTPEIFKAMYKTAMNGYVGQLPKYDIKFSDTIGLVDFLEGDCQIMLLTTENTRDEAFIVRNILQQIEIYKDQFCLFSCKDLEYLEKNVDVAAVFASNSCVDNILIVDFEDVKSYWIIRKLYEITQKRQSSWNVEKKIICITQHPNLKETDQEEPQIPTLMDMATQECLKDLAVIHKIVKEASLSDLIVTSSDIIVNQKIVSLNGSELALREFSTNEYLPLLLASIPLDVLKANFLDVKKPEMIRLNFENEHCKQVFLNLTSAKVLKNIEIDRLECLIRNYDTILAPIIGKSIEDTKFLITGVKEGFVLKSLGSRYEDQIIFNSTTNQNDGLEVFTDLCLKNPRKVIFRLHQSNPEDYALKWLQIFDSDLYIQRKFIMEDREVNEEELLEMDEDIILISNDPGMGKSATLLNLAKKIQNGWIFWINLIDAHKYIEKEAVNLDNVVAFLLKFNQNSSELIKILLKFSLVCQNSLPVYLFFDAFDEIQNVEGKRRNEIKNKILEILKCLKEKTLAKMFVSTRTNDCKMLQEELNVTGIKLKEINEKEQVEFCTKFWMSRLSLNGYNSIKMKKKLSSYAEDILDNVNTSIDKYTLSFLGIPLQLRMVTEIFQPNNIEHITREKFNFNLYELYSKFEDKKYSIYFNEKKCFSWVEYHDIVLNYFRKKHRICGVNHFFPTHKEIYKKYLSDLDRIGLIQVNSGAINFVHQTFAEYFAADYLVTKMKNPLHKGVQAIMVNNVLSKFEYNMIRSFMKDIFETQKLGCEILKFVPEVWEKIQSCGLCYNDFHKPPCKFTMLHNLVQGNDAKWVQFILENYHNKSSKTALLNAMDLGGNTPLHQAIATGNVESALVLLSNHPNVNIRNEEGDTCLHLSAKKVGLNVVSLELLEKDADANVKNNKKMDPWDVACGHQNWDLLFEAYERYEYDVFFVEKRGGMILRAAAETNQTDLAVKLIDKGFGFNPLEEEPLFLEYCRWNLIKFLTDIKKRTNFNSNDQLIAKELLTMKDIWPVAFTDINFKNSKNQTSLHFAIGQDNIKIAQKLIKVGSDINTLDVHNITPAYLAATRQHWTFILPHLHKIDFRILGPNNENLFHLACDQNQPKIASEIIKKGNIDLNAVDTNGRTPLLIAAEKKLWGLVSELLKQDIKVNISNNTKETPLHFACLHNKSDLAAELVKKGADLNFGNQDGDTPMLLAAKNGNWDLISILIKFNASVNTFNSKKETLLHYACAQNKLDKVLDLIINGADVNAKDKDRRTPLLYAAKNKNWNLVAEFIKLNADFKISDFHNVTVLHYACRDNQGDLVISLIKKGCDVYAIDKYGDSPFDLALENGHVELVDRISNLSIVKF